MERITLKMPVTVNGVEYAELHMRRSKVKDRVAVSNIKDPIKQELHLLANLCEVAPSVLEELDELDYLALKNVYLGFFGLPAMTYAEK